MLSGTSFQNTKYSWKKKKKHKKMTKYWNGKEWLKNLKENHGTMKPVKQSFL